MGARWGRRKLFVECAWSKPRRQRRAVQEDLGLDQVAVNEGEVDVHLNPKSGLDWLLKGVQKWVRTRGQHKKLYLTGALNRSAGSLEWVNGVRKRSQVFIDRIEAVAQS